MLDDKPSFDVSEVKFIFCRCADANWTIHTVHKQKQKKRFNIKLFSIMIYPNSCFLFGNRKHYENSQINPDHTSGHFTVPE